jgi:uncharacterized membrane protein
MPTGRMEAFSDGVIAILITVMVLELGVPHGTSWSALGLARLRDALGSTRAYVFVALIWLVPDRRVERTVAATAAPDIR